MLWVMRYGSVNLLGIILIEGRVGDGSLMEIGVMLMSIENLSRGRDSSYILLYY